MFAMAIRNKKKAVDIWAALGARPLVLTVELVSGFGKIKSYGNPNAEHWCQTPGTIGKRCVQG